MTSPVWSCTSREDPVGRDPAAADVAQRTCYPHKALEPLLETLEAMGRRGTA